MTEKFVLLQHPSAINAVVSSTFQETQRIKITAFDVSNKYLIFGVNSGGIYIFDRETCQFIKLIPSTFGAVNLLAVSNNEEHLALAISTGLIIVLEDCFKDVEPQQQMFADFEGAAITAMKWNRNNLYCGDSLGRVSLITIKNFLTKAMFQTPMVCLMHLDSLIVQLDTLAKFLLVSTQSRTLLCDTESERYKQIGRKPRDGCFGACFLHASDSAFSNDMQVPIRGNFQTISDNEVLSPTTVDDNSHIYCARPGVRLWQADFEANVTFTLQFRTSLTQEQSEVILWDCDDPGLKFFKTDNAFIANNFNFGRIYQFLNKFILTFWDDGFYVLDPTSSVMVQWSSHVHSIRDIRIINSFLYVWHSDGEVCVLSLCSIEELIIKSLMRKSYHLCAEICVKYFDDVNALVSTSQKIHLVSILESKLQDPQLLNKLTPIFESLRNCLRIPIIETSQDNLVVANMSPEIIEKIIPIKKNPRDVLLEQYRINKITKTVESTECVELMQSLHPNVMLELVSDFEQKMYEEDCKLWCYEMYLKYLDLSQDLSSDAQIYACEAFSHLNNSQHLSCKCCFPLPEAHASVPHYYETGCQLMQKTDDQETFLRIVPYMHKYHLLKIIDLKEIQINVPLIIQFSDSTVVAPLLSKITYDVWDDCIKLLLKLKNGYCLNCGRHISVVGTFKWTDLGVWMVQSIKANNAIKLLKPYVNLLPKGELNQFFYQYCIFSTASNVNSTAFDKMLSDGSVKNQFELALGRYLQNKQLRGDDYRTYDLSCTVFAPNCDYCQLPLKTPIIKDRIQLECGHNYHMMCYLYNKNHCLLCDTVL